MNESISCPLVFRVSSVAAPPQGLKVAVHRLSTLGSDAECKRRNTESRTCKSKRSGTATRVFLGEVPQLLSPNRSVEETGTPCPFRLASRRKHSPIKRIDCPSDINGKGFVEVVLGLVSRLALLVLVEVTVDVSPIQVVVVAGITVRVVVVVRTSPFDGIYDSQSLGHIVKNRNLEAALVD